MTLNILKIDTERTLDKDNPLYGMGLKDRRKLSGKDDDFMLSLVSLT